MRTITPSDEMCAGTFIKGRIHADHFHGTGPDRCEVVCPHCHAVQGARVMWRDGAVVVVRINYHEVKVHAAAV